MEIINEIDLSISEFQDINELSAEELEAVSGGEFWEDVGYSIGEVIEIPGEIIESVTRGFRRGIAPDSMSLK